MGRVTLPQGDTAAVTERIPPASHRVMFATGAKSELDIIHVDDTLSVCGGIQVTRP